MDKVIGCVHLNKLHLFQCLPDRPPVSKFTVFRTVKRFEETGMVKDRERPGRL